MNDIHGNASGQEALDAMITRSTDALLKRKNNLIKPIVIRHRKKFKLFWLRGDSAFADPDIYDFCETNRVTYFIRLRSNAVLAN